MKCKCGEARPRMFYAGPKYKTCCKKCRIAMARDPESKTVAGLLINRDQALKFWPATNGIL